MPTRPPSATIHRTSMRRRRVAGLLAVFAIVGVLCDQLLASSAPTVADAPTVTGPVSVPVAEPRTPGSGPAPEITEPEREQEREREREPAPQRPELAGTENLDPELLDALRRAAADAADDGVGLRVESGWRSPEHQQELLDEAVRKYGSAEEAARWVATPERSAHVSGDAVDIGPPAARTWLSEHGAAYGLCQIYVNEPWHFELRADAADAGCPPMYSDPTHDPRLQR